MTRIEHAIEGLDHRIDQEMPATIPFRDFAGLIARDPRRNLRGIFQYFEDMILHFAKPLPERELRSLRNLTDNVYDPDSLFVHGIDQPFFTDHFFMEDVLRLAHGLAQGQQNRFYLLAGDPGSGKSRLVNALLTRFEQYSRSADGTRYETVWRLEDDKGPFEVPCPHHDNPILIIPKERRREFLRDLLDDPKEIERLSANSGYSWLWTREACPVCDSIATSLRHRDGFKNVLETLHAQPYVFNRKVGQGLSVYNPGDAVSIDEVIRDQELERRINAHFSGSAQIPYYHSRLAKTNDGVLVIMDVQGDNVGRLRKLHSIISDEVHRTIDLEERTSSLFLVTVNPNDERRKEGNIVGPVQDPTTRLAGAGEKPAADSEGTRFLSEKSFIDRGRRVTVPYLLDYRRELSLYRSQFGEKTLRHGLLPGILGAFAKAIVSTRISNQKSEAVAEALAESKDAYGQYSDPNYVLLRLELFAGVIPDWLAEQDRKRFTKETLKRIRTEFPHDGRRGVSGRDANEHLSRLLGERDRIVERNPTDRMGMIRLASFIEDHLLGKGDADLVKPEFLTALRRTYHYDILQQINRSLFQLNLQSIDEEVDDYLFRLSMQDGQVERSPFTGREIIASETEIAKVEDRIGTPPAHREQYREGLRRDLATLHLEVGTLTRELLHQQPVFSRVRDAYIANVRSNTLRAHQNPQSLRDAVREYGTDGFRSYPESVQSDARRLLVLMRRAHQYTLPGAKQIVLYVIDNKLYLPNADADERRRIELAQGS